MILSAPVAKADTNTDCRDYAKTRISLFRSLKTSSQPQCSTTLGGLFAEIRDGAHRRHVEALRAETSEDAISDIKASRLAAVSLSGEIINGTRTAAMEEGRLRHSGLIQVDLDEGDLGGMTPERARDTLASDPHTVAAFISPTGTGAKGVMAIPVCKTTEEHKQAFAGVGEYLQKKYGFKIDASTKDPLRVCLVSYDPDARWNNDAIPLPIKFGTAPAKATPKAGPPEHGIHAWIMSAARRHRRDGLSEEETLEKIRAFDGTMRRRFKTTEVEDAVRKVYSTELPTVAEIDGMPAVELPCAGRTLGEFAADVGNLLSGAGVYCRGGFAFRINTAGKKLEPIEPQFLRTWAESEIRLFKTHVSKGDKQIALKQSMTTDTASALVMAPQFLEALPVLEKFQPVRMPVMRASGAVELLPFGFDAESLTLTDETGIDYDTELDPEAAIFFLNELLAEFPFADARSRAVAVAAMLTVYAGGLLPKGSTVPAFLFQGNAEGSGKTTLAKLAGAPYGSIECKPAPTTEAEWQKRLLALVMSGRRLVLLDNLKGHLNSPSLEGYLTASRYGDRILGVSKDFEGDADAVILLTGNGLTVTPDMRRRVLVTELFMRELRAEDRQFKRRLDEPAMMEMQSQILASLWALVRHWLAAGRPASSRMNSSFPRWCEVIGGIVESAGFGCPSVPAELETGGDTDTRDITRLGEAMTIGNEYTFAELVGLCATAGLFERFTDQTDEAGSLTAKAKSQFGKTLGRYAGRTVADGRVFTSTGKGHAKRYQVHSPTWSQGQHGV